MSSSVKIILDSENRENNEIIINGTNMIDCITSIKFEWEADEIPKYSIKFIKGFENAKGSDSDDK